MCSGDHEEDIKNEAERVIAHLRPMATSAMLSPLRIDDQLGNKANDRYSEEDMVCNALAVIAKADNADQHCDCTAKLCEYANKSLHMLSNKNNQKVGSQRHLRFKGHAYPVEPLYLKAHYLYTAVKSGDVDALTIANVLRIQREFALALVNPRSIKPIIEVVTGVRNRQ